MPKNNEELKKEVKSDIDGISVSDILKTTHGKIEKMDSAMSDIKEKMSYNYRRRFGIREERTFPWVNCSNHSLRLADKIIKKAKPHYYSLVNGMGGRHVEVLRTNENEREKALKTKNIMDYILEFGMPEYKEKMWGAIDKMMMFDWVIIAPYWKRITSVVDKTIDLIPFIESGMAVSVDIKLPENIAKLAEDLMTKDNITLDPDDSADLKTLIKIADAIIANESEITIKEEIYVANHNDIRVVDPRLFVFDIGAQRIQDSEIVCEKIKFTERELYEAKRNGQFRADVCQQIIDKGGNWTDTTDVENYRKIREKRYDYADTDTDFYEIRKVYAWIKTENDDFRRACIFYSTADISEPLSFRWFDQEDVPYVQYFMEVNEGLAASPRGVVTLVDVFDRLINAQFNDMMNRRMITTTPMITQIPTQVYADTMRYIPGQIIKVKDHNAIKPIQMGINADIVYERGILSLRAQAEEMMSVPDFAITDPGTSMRGGDETRTATEMRMIGGLKEQSIGMDAQVFNRCQERMFKIVLQQWIENAPESIKISIEGQDQQIEKKDILPNALFKATSIFASDRLQRKQEARELYALVTSDPKSDMFYDQYLAREMLLQAEDDPAKMRILRTREAITDNIKKIEERQMAIKNEQDAKENREILADQVQSRRPVQQNN